MKKMEIAVARQLPIPIYYEVVVGNFKADIVVDEPVFIEVKSAEKIEKEFEVQLVNYLTPAIKPVRLLLNFFPHKVGVKGKVRILAERKESSKSFSSCYPVKSKQM